MASSARGRYKSAGSRRGRRFGGGWKLLSVLIVAATLAMIAYGWTLTREDRAEAAADAPGPAATGPAAVEPEPTAVASEPATAEPEPTAVEPEPTAAEPEPTAVGSEPTAAPQPTAEPERTAAEPLRPLSAPASTPAGEEAGLPSESVGALMAGAQAPQADVQEGMTLEKTATNGLAVPLSAGAETEPEPSDEVATLTEWPTEEFPGISAFPGDSFDVLLEGGRAEVLLPAGSDALFPDYAKALVADGASVYLENDQMIVLVLGDVEIQLLPDPESPVIVLCGEPAVAWEDPDDVLPQSGRLVSQEPGIDGLGAVLTYRCVSFADLMNYQDLLRREGWVSVDQAKPENSTLYTTYQRGDRAVIIDYYANSPSFQVTVGMAAAG